MGRKSKDWQEEDEKKKKKGKRKSLFRSLFSSNLRSRSVGQLLDPTAAPPPDAQQPQQQPLAEQPRESTSSPPATPCRPSTPPSTPPSAARVPDDLAADEPGGGATGPRALMVQVIQARRLRAADSNGLSDPYCVVKVGEHKSATRTELKTLEPRWNETMAFSAADCEDAEAGGRPYVGLRVFDWDLVSADDFLGQAELAFADVDPTVGAKIAPQWLPLYGWKGGKAGQQRIAAGEIQVAAWWQAGGSGPGQQGGAALSTLCCEPGTRKQVPMVVHSSQGSLYEEPLIACLAVSLERITDLHVPAAASAAAAARAAATEPPASPVAGQPASRALGQSTATRASRAPSSPGSARGPRGVFGRLLGSGRAGGRGLPRSTSISSVVSDDMLAGEDAGDEYDGLNFYGGHREAPVFEDESEDEEGGMLAFDDGMEDESGSPRASHGKASRWRRRNASSSAGSSEDGPLARLSPQLNGSDGSGPVAAPPRKPRPGPSGLETVGEEQLLRSGSVGAAGLTGMRCYARLVLGRQQHTSWIKKERLDGTLNLHQTFVFAVPLPLRDRQLRLELYRTASNTQRGRLVSIQQVWLSDLVPPGLEDNPAAARRSAVQLDGVVKGQRGGCAHLRSTLVDTDLRRAAYQAEYVEAEAAGLGDRGGAGADADREALHRLQSTTEGYTSRELRRKALLSEDSFAAWQGATHTRLEKEVSGLLPRMSDLALDSWRRMSGLFAPADEPGSLAADAAAQAAGGVPRAPAPLPQPAGTLQLTVDRITVGGPASTAECFFVLKCGPHWGRSRPLPMAGQSSVECGWQLSLPLLDPSCVLTLAVFQQSRGKRDKGRGGLLPPSAVQTVGKLRVRLSCLWPNTPLSAELPLLGERAKGARVAGAVHLTLQAAYASTGALVKGYTAPALPKAAYVHRVDDKAHQAALGREARRIVLRWLDAANPAIGGPQALVVLDAEREVFAMSRARVNMRRIQMALVGVRRAQRKLDAIKAWKEPRESLAAMAGICLLCFLPRLAIPALLLWLAGSTLASQPGEIGLPPPMEGDPPGTEPENESLETTTANPVAALRLKLDRLQRVGLTIQGVLDDVASAMERAGALLSWQDPSATLGACAVLAAVAALIFVLGLSAVLAFVGCFLIRPPKLRTPTPALPAVVLSKLPTRGDRIV